MHYTYQINHDYKMINVITKGDLIIKELAPMELKISKIAKQLKYKIIYDYRLSKNRISMAEAYFWFSDLYDKVDWELRKIPLAYLVNKEDWKFYLFFECTSVNKGFPIKVFQEEMPSQNGLTINEYLLALDIHNKKI